MGIDLNLSPTLGGVVMAREYMAPEEIEAKSMEMIENELAGWQISFEEKEIIKRVIHTTVDFDFGKGIIFHPSAIKAGILAITSGGNIITDVHMVKAGIRAYQLERFGNTIHCFLDKDNKDQGNLVRIPRAVLGMRKAIPLLNGSIVAIGNAPTALFEVVDLVQAEKVRPALIIGVPVGFVGATESKEALREINVPYITNTGRRGGSTVACAIVNALIKLSYR